VLLHKLGERVSAFRKGARASEVGSKSPRILGANSVTLSTKYVGKLGFYHQLFCHRYAFFPGWVGDRENRLFATVPQVC